MTLWRILHFLLFNVELYLDGIRPLRATSYLLSVCFVFVYYLYNVYFLVVLLLVCNGRGSVLCHLIFLDPFIWHITIFTSPI